MVTINNQWIEQVSRGVNFSFPINCKHSKNIAFESSNIQGTTEFNADVQSVVSAYEYSFKTSPDYSTQDLNLNVASWEVITFNEGVGVVSVEFTVENAEITITQYYGFDESVSTKEVQNSVISQVEQYEENYKTGYNLVNLV